MPARSLRLGEALVLDDTVDPAAVRALASMLGRKWAPRLRVAGVSVPPEPTQDAAIACARLGVDWRDVERHFLSEFP